MVTVNNVYEIMKSVNINYVKRAHPHRLPGGNHMDLGQMF